MSMTDKKAVEAYDFGNLHFEIWCKESAHVYYLIWLKAGYMPEVQAYASAASARRAMYKVAWDFSPARRETLPRKDCAVL